MARAKGKGTYIDLPEDLRNAAEEIAIARSKPGARIPLRQIVVDALEDYISKYNKQQSTNNEQGKEQRDG